MILQRAAINLSKDLSKGKRDMLDLWNKSQPFYLAEVSKFYAELVATQEFFNALTKSDNEANRAVMLDLFRLYVLTRMQATLVEFRSGNYLTTEKAEWVKDLIIKTCHNLKPHIISICDAVSPREELIGTPLAAPDGDLYGQFMKVVYQAPGVYDRPSWWKLVHENN